MSISDQVNDESCQRHVVPQFAMSTLRVLHQPADCKVLFGNAVQYRFRRPAATHERVLNSFTIQRVDESCSVPDEKNPVAHDRRAMIESRKRPADYLATQPGAFQSDGESGIARDELQKQFAQVIRRRGQGFKDHSHTDVGFTGSSWKEPVVPREGRTGEKEIRPVVWSPDSFVIGAHRDDAILICRWRPSHGSADDGATTIGSDKQLSAKLEGFVPSQSVHDNRMVVHLKAGDSNSLKHTRARFTRRINSPSIQLNAWNATTVGGQWLDIGEHTLDQFSAVKVKCGPANNIRCSIVVPSCDTECFQLNQCGGADKIATHFVARKVALFQNEDARSTGSQARRRRGPSGTAADNDDIGVQSVPYAKVTHDFKPTEVTHNSSIFLCPDGAPHK